MKILSLFIDNKACAFFNAELSFSIDQLAHTFRCDIPPLQIGKPLSVEFKLDKQSIFTGAIDSISTDTSSSGYSMQISGRSKSANMIDSRITMDAQYNQTLESLLRVIAKDFGLTVERRVDASKLKIIEEFQINAESPIDNFAQLIKEQGFILIERNGVLCIENQAQGAIANVALKVGDNIGSLSIERNFAEQFYHIEVRSQYGDASAKITYAPANTDRIKVIISDQLQTQDACQSRAEYERNFAIARGLSVSTSIDSLFIELTGSAINRTLRVIDVHQDFNEILLVKSVVLSVSESKVSTALTLFRPFKESANV